MFHTLRHKVEARDAILYFSMLIKISDSFSRFYHATIRFLAHHKTYTAFLFVAITAIGLYVVFSVPKTTQETFTTSLASISQYVKVSGQVESSKDANLSFQTTGAVAHVGVKIGDIVGQGKVLATLSAGDAQAALLQAQANLASVEAVFAQLQQGARKEEIAIKEQTLTNTKSTLDQSYNTLPDAIQNVDAITADVVKNKFSTLFALNGNHYTLSFNSCDQKLSGELEMKRTALENTLADFQVKSSVITTLSSTQTIDTTFELAYQAALATNDLVNTTSNLLLAPCSLTNTSLDGYRATLSLVKGSMTALFSDIALKRSSLIASKNAFNQANRDLELTKAGTDPYRIKSQAAQVAQAEAQVAQAKSGLSKTIITAPFSGVVSNVELSLGETVTPGKTVVKMIATDGFEIEAKVPEIDIVKIKVGAPVEVTLDAYGKSVIFPASVTRVNPSSTQEGTVPVYKVIITFTGKDERIKQGMTANIKIVTENKSKTLVVPARFIKLTNSAQGTVVVLTGGKQATKEVSLGIRGADGSLEVTNGLVEGEVLLAPTTIDRQAQKQTN